MEEEKEDEEKEEDELWRTSHPRPPSNEARTDPRLVVGAEKLNCQMLDQLSSQCEPAKENVEIIEKA